MKHSPMIIQSKKSPRRLKAVLWLFFAVLAGFLCTVRPAGAQDDLSSSLVLRDDATIYNLGPYLYVTTDPGGKLSFQDIVTRHNNPALRGEGIRGNVVTLGAAAVPHWIIFDVVNSSWTEKWVMTFGQHMQGRVGLVKQIFLYDARSRTKYLDNITAVQNPYVSAEGKGATSVAVNIPHGREALFFLYVVPEAGMPATLTPRLMTDQAFTQITVNPLQPSRVINFFFSGMVGFFLAALIFQRYWGANVFLL
jgi:hypothetical protein